MLWLELGKKKKKKKKKTALKHNNFVQNQLCNDMSIITNNDIVVA